MGYNAFQAVGAQNLLLYSELEALVAQNLALYSELEVLGAQNLVFYGELKSVRCTKPCMLTICFKVQVQHPCVFIGGDALDTQTLRLCNDIEH